VQQLADELAAEEPAVDGGVDDPRRRESSQADNDACPNAKAAIRREQTRERRSHGREPPLQGSRDSAPGSIGELAQIVRPNAAP
jgi:hypothetical protein